MAPVPLLLSPRSRTPATDYVVVEYLVVAGGGRGGPHSPLLPDQYGAGGGAGGLLSGTLALARGVATTVTVGAGSDGAQPSQNSVLGTLTAIGGGDGGGEDESGSSGGSGGGGGLASGGTTSGGAGTSGQGSAGDGGTTTAAGAGGGSGTTSSITGAAVTYATGGPVSEAELPPANSGNGGRGGTVIDGSGIVVSGAGTAAVNGTYQQGLGPETLNGKPVYRKVSDASQSIAWAGSAWQIRSGPDVVYELSGQGSTPSGTATVVGAGAAPAPSIAADTTTLLPQAGASGVVVVAYSDTLPALTIGAGLTYDQPSRSGYRVYRFTAGSGSISIG